VNDEPAEDRTDGPEPTPESTRDRTEVPKARAGDADEARGGGFDDGLDGGFEPGLEDDEDPDYENPAVAKRKRIEAEKRAAWGSWKQDREANRRKVLRSLVSLVVVALLTGFVAYGCDLLRGPRQVRLNDQVADYVLQAPTSETEQLAGRFEAAGAVGPAARYYSGPHQVLFVAGYSTELPTDVLSSLLPAVVSGELVYTGRGGPLDCGATADGSRCVWKSSDVVGGTSAKGVSPTELEKTTRDLRAGALK
jgi:hypothetical protein